MEASVWTWEHVWRVGRFSTRISALFASGAMTLNGIGIRVSCTRLPEYFRLSLETTRAGRRTMLALLRARTPCFLHVSWWTRQGIQSPVPSPRFSAYKASRRTLGHCACVDFQSDRGFRPSSSILSPLIRPHPVVPFPKRTVFWLRCSNPMSARALCKFRR